MFVCVCSGGSWSLNSPLSPRRIFAQRDAMQCNAIVIVAVAVAVTALVVAVLLLLLLLLLLPLLL